MRRNPRADVKIVVEDPAGQLSAGGHPELPEHLSQVVLHCARTEKQLGGDLPVRLTSAHQRGDLCLLGRELLREAGFPLAGAFASGPQLDGRPPGKGGEPHAVEHVVRRTQLLACFAPATLAAQPLAIEEVSTRNLGSGSGPVEQVKRILVLLPGLGRDGQQGPRARAVPVAVARSSNRWRARSARSRWPARVAASTRSGNAWVPTNGVSSV